MPSHIHEFSLTYGSALTSNINNHMKILGGASGNSWLTNGTFDQGNQIGSAGGNQAHNNVQPSITVYRYKRTS